MVLRHNDNQEIMIEEVLHVLGLKTNLLSLGQLLQKGFMITIEDNYLNIFEKKNERLVIQAHLSQNKTFRVVMKALKLQCFATSESQTE